MSSVALAAHEVSVAFGGVRAVDRVSISVPSGGLVGLIGPNGAGKTTFIDAISGFVPASGQIEFDGRRIDGMPAHRRVRQGLARTFQSVELFADLTVAANLRAHADPHGMRRRAGDTEEVTREKLALFGVEWTADYFPSELPHGTRRLVSLARALASSPKVLLLDEPAAGLEIAETRELGTRLRSLVEGGGISVLLVDHDMDLVLKVCDYVYVLNFGTVLAAGTPATIRSNADVLEAYLGGAVAENDVGAAEGVQA